MNGYRLEPSLLRAYDIRGIVGASLNPRDALFIGRGFGSILKDAAATAVCVGRDGRLSSPNLAEALRQGLVSCGLRVIDLGVVPTPMLYYGVHHLAVGGGIMVTGSHNPPQHNGFKFMLGRKSFYGEALQELGRRIEQGAFHLGDGLVQKESLACSYIELLRVVVGNSGRSLNAVWDAGNGASGEIVTQLVKHLKGRQQVICGEVDGNFPHHHPDPTVEANLTMLKDAVVKGGYDMGFAFDGDGDRVGVVDDKGKTLYSDQLLAFLAQDVLKNHPQATLVSDIKAGHAFIEHVRQLGGRTHLIPTGHSIMKTEMARVKAPFGGEMSGHIFFADDYYGYDDGIYAALRFMAWLERQNKPLSVLRKALPRRYHSGELRLACEDGYQFEVVARIAQALRRDGVPFQTVDGVRVDDDDGWWLIRASNTQSIVVAVCESANQEGFERHRATLAEHLAACGVTLPPVQPRQL